MILLRPVAQYYVSSESRFISLQITELQKSGWIISKETTQKQLMHILLENSYVGDHKHSSAKVSRQIQELFYILCWSDVLQI